MGLRPSLPRVEKTGADRAGQVSDLIKKPVRIVHRAVGLEHDITDLAVGLVILRGDVHGPIGEDIVEPPKLAGQVALDLDEARADWPHGQLHLGEVDRAPGGADIGIVDELSGDFSPDALLRFLRGAPDVRRQDHVVEPLQRRDEAVRIGLRLDREHIDRSPPQVPVGKGPREGLQIQHRAARIVDEERTPLHGAYLAFADQVLGRRRFRHVERDDVGPRQQIHQAVRRLDIAVPQLVGLVKIDHPHAHGFRKHGKLRADVAVPDDPQCLAPDLMAVDGRLLPPAGMGLGRFGKDAPIEHHGFGNGQFRDRARVRERRVEHGDARPVGRDKIDLIGADRKASDSHEPIGGLEDLRRQFGARTDAQHVHALHRFLQRLGIERRGNPLDGRVARAFQNIDRRLRDAFEQKEPDVFLGQGQGLGHGNGLDRASADRRTALAGFGLRGKNVATRISTLEAEGEAGSSAPAQSAFARGVRSMPAHHDRLELKSPEARERDLFRRLPGLIATARKLPAWKAHLGRLDPKAVDSRAALADLPILRKADLPRLQKDNPPFAGLIPGKLGSFAHLFTSPGPILEPQAVGDDVFHMGRALTAAGFSRGDVVLNTFSYHLTPGGWIFDTGARAIGCAVIPAGPGNTEAQLDLIEAYRPQAYVGVPDFLKILLDAGKEKGRDVSSITKAMVSGAAFPPSLQAEIKSRGIEAYQAYAIAECGVIAYETPARQGLTLSEDIILELVRPGTGDPVREGEVGEVVITVLDPHHPLIRFAVGDLTAVLPGISPCGRTNTRIKGWMGRADQTAKIKGMFVRPEQVAEITRRHPEIGKARLTVTRAGETDAMTLSVETTTCSDGFVSAVAETLQAITKLKGSVALVAPGSLPNDGKVIADERPVG